MRFHDRSDAGRRLAAALRGFRNQHPVVLALPRGGVAVGFEVARELDAPLDVILVRKIGAPLQPELAVAAVVDGERTEIVRNEDILEELSLPDSYVEKAAARELEEIHRRRALYLAGREPVPVADRTAIVVDDGIATGATVRAALRAVRRRKPKLLMLAVPVAPLEALQSLRAEVDEVVCLAAPVSFGAIGRFYTDFRQLDDDDVRSLLERAGPDGERSADAE